MAYGSDKTVVRSIFAFDSSDDKELVLKKFKLWCVRFFPQYFKYDPAEFQADIAKYTLDAYLGDLRTFVNIVFRGGAKTTYTKLFIAFAILNDQDHRRRYLKFLTKDKSNADQFVTDVYNLLISVKEFYPDTFKKSEAKKEERMGSFTTSFGVKVRAGTVGTEQRGQVQEDSRPDFIVFDDFETRKSLRSAVETQKIWDNMEEARTGLSVDGSCVYLCNYISERGNVHRLVQKKDNPGTQLLIVPIKKDDKPTWEGAYTIERINQIEAEADDFAGEYMCEPSAGADIFFNRDRLKEQPKITPIETINNLKVFHKYVPGHRYGIGADIAGGVGYDSSTSVCIDFSTMPARVVSTYQDNTIDPELFGHELVRNGRVFGDCIIAPENNKFDGAITILKQNYRNIYYTEAKSVFVGQPKRNTYGWNTNSLTKPNMLNDLKRAIEDGLLELSDENLIAELWSYSRDDLMDTEGDPRLTTRHFDLLIACAIAWQMKDWATVNKEHRPQKVLNLPKIESAYA